ncbi:MAG: hypothetical protein U9Q67_01075 [Patescibacteria group bacterium]|nr:hypothetical protein [Patescibacteria group bacterium]
MKFGKSIDLLPQMPEEEIAEVEKKGRINLSGVFFILLIVAMSIMILAADLWVHLDLNSKKQTLADTEAEILSMQYVELKQRTLNNKLDTYSAVMYHDFNSDSVLDYLMEVAEGLGIVNSLYLDDTMKFEMVGKASSYSNVARLWHDMCREKDYFSNVNLDNVRKSDEDGEIVVRFSFSGYIIKENLDNI